MERKDTPAGITAGTSFFAPFAKVYNQDRIMSIYFNQTKVEVWALNLAGLTKTSTSTSLLFNEWWDAPSEWLSRLKHTTLFRSNQRCYRPNIWTVSSQFGTKN